MKDLVLRLNDFIEYAEATKKMQDKVFYIDLKREITRLRNHLTDANKAKEGYFDAFLECYNLANDIDEETPELPEAFVGNPSDRIRRQYNALKARLAEAERQQEPIYQISMASGAATTAWIDVTKEVYDDARLYPEYRRRCLYAAPVAPARVPEGWKLVPIAEIESWKDAVDHELTQIQMTTDTFPDPQAALSALIDWHVQVALDPAVNGGYRLVPAMQVNWTECKLKLPEPMTEVLVWIDGKRGPSWKNNHALVAYMAPTGEWFEERHPSRDPLAGVLMWAPITDPGA